MTSQESTALVAAVAATVGAFSTIAYTAVSVLLWKETRKQAKATEDQLGITARQMQLTEAAYESSVRPVVGVEIEIQPPAHPTMQDRRMELKFQLTNFGQRPILDLRTTLFDFHGVFNKEVFWGNVLPQQTITSRTVTEISKELAKAWIEQIELHDGQLSFKVGMFSYTPWDQNQPSPVFSSAIHAQLLDNAELVLRSLAVGF